MWIRGGGDDAIPRMAAGAGSGARQFAGENTCRGRGSFGSRTTRTRCRRRLPADSFDSRWNNEKLTPTQLEAVLAHELCHVRRHDNLTSAIHILVEAVFWFHPLAWWIGARLVEERERACDEEVLRLGGDPRDYADAILNICKLYVESPLTCVAGVTGADLKKRIEAIMTNRVLANLTNRKESRVGCGVPDGCYGARCGRRFASPGRGTAKIRGCRNSPRLRRRR
jgi:hypothetical protein